MSGNVRKNGIKSGNINNIEIKVRENVQMLLFNKVVQRGQMDMFVRYFDINTNRVCSRYLTSIFLGRATAHHLLDGFNQGISYLSKQSILQVSMDGPNVNLKFWKMLDDQMKAEFPDGKHLVNIGVCGLHVVNGCMRTGMESVHWDLHTFLRDIYYLFNDCPARRAEFTAITSGDKFPLKHCTTRWLENVKCIDRALLVLDNVMKFIDHSKKIQSKPYKVVAKHVEDKFLKCKLAYYKVLSSECEPFLRKFQNPSPLAPYLYSNLYDLLKTLMRRCIKSSKLATVNTATKLIRIDLYDQENLIELNKMEVGFQTLKLLKLVKSSEVEVLNFRKECQKLLITLIGKFVERSPLKYKVVRGLSALDPSLILLQPEVGCIRMNSLLEALYDANRLVQNTAEKAKSQYSLLCSEVKGVLKDKFKIFAPTNEDSEGKESDKKLDVFYSAILCNNPKYIDLWDVVKLGLTFSHGNAAVESGFSINKSILVENLHEETIVSQRKVYDAIISAGGRKNVVITNKMLTSVRSARRRYGEALESKRRNQSEEEKRKAEKRKLNSKIKQLEDERKTLRMTSQVEEEQILQKIKVLQKHME